MLELSEYSVFEMERGKPANFPNPDLYRLEPSILSLLLALM